MSLFNRSRNGVRWTGAVLALAGALTFVACSSGDPLLQGFLDPPASAKARVWWHWMNGNITKDGIRADLEWMKRVGIGGFQNFDANFMTPQVVEKRLVFMTPEWKDAFTFTAGLAAELGLEMAIAGSPGWSESGGPWVTPALAMKKYVWSETRVEGGKPFTGALPQPPDTTGPMLDAPFTGGMSGVTGAHETPPSYYMDAAVVAFRSPEEDVPIAALKPTVTTSGGRIDAPLLSDGSLSRTVSLPMARAGKQVWIQFDFGRPRTVRALTLAVRETSPLAAFFGPGSEPGPELLASDDGARFRSVMMTPRATTPQVTVSVPETRARYYRIAFTTPQPQGLPAELGGLDLSLFGGAAAMPKPATAYEIAELVLHAAARVNRFEDKAAFSTATGLAAMATPAVPGGAAGAVSTDDVIDLTAKMRAMARYTESHENGRAFIADGMAVKRTAAVPMSAIWTGRGGPDGVPLGASADIRESASVAHIYGQNIAAAESLTAAGNAFGFAPETLKPLADAALSQGLNRFVIHTSVHQPLSDKRPGFSLGPFGQWFTRLETWAELAKPWMRYLARSSYLLQQGTFVADVVHYYGEDSNVTALFGAGAPDVPRGYDFDYANSDIVQNRLAVTDGRLTTTTGMSYAVLSLDANAVRMPLAVLRKIRELASAGAAVVGPKPVESPSLSDDQAEFERIAGELWGSGSGERAVGKGRVFAGMTIAEALAALRVGPDFEHSKPQADSAVLFVHRKLAGGDIYWINNRRNREESIDATFRVTGKAPELWRPDTGAVEPAAYRVADGWTVVTVRMDPNDALFVVFRKGRSAVSRALPSVTESPMGTIEGAWDVAFQPDRGAPARITLDSLTSWHEHADAGVKYFSGTATYTKTVLAPADWFRRGIELWLDLGDVKNLAEVAVNGKPQGILWKPPFRVNVTGVLTPGANPVEIKVTNLWVNRVIGDRQPGASQFTFTAMPFYRADSPLLPSGLLGPVTVLRRAVSNLR